MKNFKKIGLGLFLTLFVVLMGLLGHKALAAGISPSAWSKAKYTLKDSNTVTAVVGGQSFDFTYDQYSASCGSGNLRCYVAPSSLQSTFCNSDSFISINSSDFDLTAKSIPGAVYADYTVQPAAIPPCQQFGTPDKPKSIGISVSATAAAGANQVSITAPKDGTTVKGKVTVSVKALTSVGITGVQTTVNDSSNTTIAGATSISYAPGHTPKSWSGSGSWDTSSLPDGQYTITATLTESDGSTQKDSATVTAKNGNPPIGATKSCAANFDNFFAFIICPALSAADSIIGGIYGQVENQLCFNTGATSFTAGAVCHGTPNSLVNPVEDAWNIFKDIASALLVIVMLAMVFSQAIGGGPFDAYTVRKMLPKLVAAVIIMQLSFVLLKWAIDLSNDAGSAIGNLIMAPFGGPENMSLQRMIGNGVHVATGGAAGTDSFQVFAVLAAIAGAVWVIPALPLLALYVIVGVFIAFFVLILRKLLIIMLVMLAPIALICWVLPGTSNYWRLWRTNITKLLAMFPLIMAMLASGRVLAYITSQAGNASVLFFPRLAVIHLGPVPVPNFASATGFADLAIIIGAFFAPYFLLPKTFSWGGDLLKQAGGAVERLTNKGAEPGKKFLKNREESYRAERRLNSQKRFAAGDKFNWKRPQSYWQRPLDLARAGKIDPTLGLPGSRRRQEAQDRYVEAGEKAEAEAKAAAEARLVRDRQKIRAQGGSHDDYLQAIADGLDSYNDPNLGKVDVSHHSHSEAGRNAARSQLSKLGAGMNWRYLEDYYESTNRELQEARASGDSRRIRRAERESQQMRKFFDDNVETIITKLPHIYKSVTQAADADPNGIAQMHGVGIEAILANLSKTIKEGSAPGASDEQARKGAAAQSSLTTFLQNFQRAVENSQRGGPQLENGELRAVKAFLTSDDDVAQDLLQGINLGGDPALGKDIHGRQPTHRQSVLPGSHKRALIPLGRAQDLTFDDEHAAQMSALRDSLGGLIDEAGYVRAQAPAPTNGHTETVVNREVRSTAPTTQTVREVSNAQAQTAQGIWTRGAGGAQIFEPAVVQPTVNVDLSGVSGQFETLSRAAESMNEAAYHMRQASANQARATRAVSSLGESSLRNNPEGSLDIHHNNEDNDDAGNS